ncbi:MAG: choice-of-anchor K domain-containing protein, partial [Syntrophales bacterium]|nr:choice-of-anchor K domain-containing protein [Syntrophales bacterium]
AGAIGLDGYPDPDVYLEDDFDLEVVEDSFAAVGNAANYESLDVADNSETITISDTINDTTVTLEADLPELVENWSNTEVTFTATVDNEVTGEDLMLHLYTGEGEEAVLLTTITIPVGATTGSSPATIYEDDGNLSVYIGEDWEGGNYENLITGNPVNIEITDTVPSLEAETGLSVDETEGLQSVTGDFEFDYGLDGPGSIELNADEDATWDPDSLTLSADDGTWKVVVNVEDGTYTFTQLKAINHPDENDPHDQVDITFKATVTDADGSTVSQNITVTVYDDGPQEAHDESWVKVQIPVSEATISGYKAGWWAEGERPWDTKVINKIEGNDGDEYYEGIYWGGGTGLGDKSGYTFIDNSDLKEDGDTVTLGENVMLGTFTHINKSIPSGTGITGAWLKVTFNVVVDGETVPVDHWIRFDHTETPNNYSPSTNPGNNDIVTISEATASAKVPVGDVWYTVEILGFSKDGGNTFSLQASTVETKSTSFDLYAKVYADVYYTPTVEGDLNVDYGTDGAHATEALAFPDHEYQIGDENVVVQGTYGELTVFEDGTYEYKVYDDVRDEMGKGTQYQDEFRYTVKDADGDTVESTLTINVVGMGAADKIVQGTSGDNTLIGGEGDDILIGGLGADTFVVGLGDDTILDYNQEEGDVVDISSVFEDGFTLGVADNAGKAQLNILNGEEIVGSVTFDTIEYGNLDPDYELDSLLGMVNIDDGTTIS